MACFYWEQITVPILNWSALCVDNPWFLANPHCRDVERHKEIANLEAQVYHLVELLSEQRNATRDNVQRKQARTGEEREESDDENASDDDSDDDENGIPYNPKNLPLGWDGKVVLNTVPSV